MAAGLVFWEAGSSRTARLLVTAGCLGGSRLWPPAAPRRTCGLMACPPASRPCHRWCPRCATSCASYRHPTRAWRCAAAAPAQLLQPCCRLLWLACTLAYPPRASMLHVPSRPSCRARAALTQPAPRPRSLPARCRTASRRGGCWGALRTASSACWRRPSRRCRWAGGFAPVCAAQGAVRAVRGASRTAQAVPPEAGVQGLFASLPQSLDLPGPAAPAPSCSSTQQCRMRC